MKRTLLFITAALLTTTSMAHAQLIKTLDSGPDPVGMGKPEATPYTYTIHLDANFDPTQVIKDTMPAEFDIANAVASCGTVTFGEKPKKNPGSRPKKQPDKIRWDLNGCDPTASQSLIVFAVTDQNPGGAKKGIVRFEPTECGPLTLNEGAELPAEEGNGFLSNSLVVATCQAEGTEGCVDGDDDGWSIDCADCNDANPAINPAAAEVCGDAIDNDCDTQADEGC